MKDPNSISNCLLTKENTQRHQISQYFPISFSEAFPPVLKGTNARNQKEKLQIIPIICMYLKGHSQLMHMRIRYHFIADLHVTRHARETESEKRIRNT